MTPSYVKKGKLSIVCCEVKGIDCLMFECPLSNKQRLFFYLKENCITKKECNLELNREIAVQHCGVR